MLERRLFRTLVRSLYAVLFAAVSWSAPVHAQVTSLTFISDPGDYIGQGQFLFFTPTDGTFGAQQNSGQGVSVSFNSLDHFWYLDFAAPNNQPLTVGSYTGAARFPFQASNQPGLAIYGDGRGCNTDTGSFQVLEITYGANNDITAFDAHFEQHCEGATPALRGEIRYGAHVVVNVTAPSHLTAIQNQNLNFTVTATDAQQRHVVLTATGLPPGSTFVDNGNNTGTFNWTPPGGAAFNYVIKFQGNNQAGNIGSTYTQLSVIPPPPPNDDFDHPTVVPSIPFAQSYDATNATVAADDPFCFGRNQTLWFKYTPSSNIRIEANTFGSTFDTTLSVYTGARGSLAQIACNDDSGGTLQSRVRFDAVAGTTYYFMVSSLYPVPLASVLFNVVEAPPPFSFVPSVLQFGSVSPTTGMATINGSVNCTSPSFVTISGQLKQMHGGTSISGYFSAFVPCDGTTAWAAGVSSQTALFHGRSVALFVGGKASITASASAFDPDTGEYKQVNFSGTITLRGAK
jgi:hypothetical protein